MTLCICLYFPSVSITLSVSLSLCHSNPFLSTPISHPIILSPHIFDSTYNPVILTGCRFHSSIIWTAVVAVQLYFTTTPAQHHLKWFPHSQDSWDVSGRVNQLWVRETVTTMFMGEVKVFLRHIKPALMCNLSMQACIVMMYFFKFGLWNVSSVWIMTHYITGSFHISLSLFTAGISVILCHTSPHCIYEWVSRRKQMSQEQREAGEREREGV